MDRNHHLALGARRTLCAALGISPPCPDSMIGALAAVPLPDAVENEPSSDGDALQRALREEFGIEVPLIAWPAAPKRLLRVSAQLYNSPEDFQRLARALRALLS
jgi:isopenicillin-N epimerase